MTGPPGQPLRAGASVIDIMGAMFGVIAAQAAMRERDTTSMGQRVSSALFENAALTSSLTRDGGRRRFCGPEFVAIRRRRPFAQRR